VNVSTFQRGFRSYGRRALRSSCPTQSDFVVLLPKL
jgi:hypothetical protein